MWENRERREKMRKSEERTGENMENKLQSVLFSLQSLCTDNKGKQMNEEK